MLTREEGMALKTLISEDMRSEKIDGFTKMNLICAIERATDQYKTNDVIADGPNLSSRTMLNDAAKALGWRVDFACGDSPITWDKVIDEIRKRTKQRTVDVVDCIECKGRAAVKKREGKRVEAICIDCGCGMQWTNG